MTDYFPKTEIPKVNATPAEASAVAALASGTVASASITFGPASGMTAGQVIDIPCGTTAVPKLVRLQAQISGSPAVATAPYTILDITGMSAIQVATAVRSAVIAVEGYNLSIPATGTETLYLNQLSVGDFANVPIVTTFGGATATGFTGGVDKRDDLPLPRVPALIANGFLGVTLHNTNLFLGNGGSLVSTDESGASGPLPPHYEIQTNLGGHLAGTHNLTCGQWAGYHLRLGNVNTLVGTAAGYSLDNGDQNTIVGTYAGLMSVGGFHNTFLGAGAGQMNVDGNLNVYIGTDNSLNGITGSFNVGVGSSSGTANAGTYNTYVGYACFHACTSGQYNTCLGSASLFNLVTGKFCTAVGYGAGSGNTTGSSNSIYGNQALSAQQDGSTNCAFGSWAGTFIADGVAYNTTCSDSMFFGKGARAKASGGTNELVFGTNAIGLGSNTAVWGNTATTINRFYGSVGVGTDAPPYQFFVKAATNNAYPFGIGLTDALSTKMAFQLNSSGAVPYFVLNVGNTGVDAYYLGDVNNNWCLGGFLADSSARKCLVLSNAGVAPAASADMVHIYAKDNGAGHATLGIFAEEVVAAVGVKTVTEYFPILINGTVKNVALVA